MQIKHFLEAKLLEFLVSMDLFEKANIGYPVRQQCCAHISAVEREKHFIDLCCRPVRRTRVKQPQN